MQCIVGSLYNFYACDDGDNIIWNPAPPHLVLELVGEEKGVFQHAKMQGEKREAKACCPQSPQTISHAVKTENHFFMVYYIMEILHMQKMCHEIARHSLYGLICLLFGLFCLKLSYGYPS